MPSPYLQYYWFTDEILKSQVKSRQTRAQQVMEIEKQVLAGYRQPSVNKEPQEIQRGGKWHADMMIGMLGAIANDARQIFIANVPNHGALPELPYEKIVEVRCV